MKKKARTLVAMYAAAHQGVISRQYVTVRAALARAAVHHGVVLSFTVRASPLPPNS